MTPSSDLCRHVSNVNGRVAATNTFLKEKAEAVENLAGDDATDGNTSSCAEEAASIKPNRNRKLANGHSAGASLADVQKYKAAAQVFMETYGSHVRDGTVPSDIRGMSGLVCLASYWVPCTYRLRSTSMDAGLVERVMNAFNAAGVEYGTAFDGAEIDDNGQLCLLAEENSETRFAGNAGRMLSCAPLPASLLDACEDSRHSLPLHNKGCVHVPSVCRNGVMTCKSLVGNLFASLAMGSKRQPAG